MPQLTINGRLEVLAERQAYLLFDRMVAFHIQRGLTAPLGAAEFYAGLRQRYSERDGAGGRRPADGLRQCVDADGGALMAF